MEASSMWRQPQGPTEGVEYFVTKINEAVLLISQYNIAIAKQYVLIIAPCRACKYF
jgi:hypothetical protein